MNAIERLRATYNFEPVDRLYRREFYIWNEALIRWRREGMPLEITIAQRDTPLEPGEYPGELADLFAFDPPAEHVLGGLGWVEPALVPGIRPCVLESTSDYELVRDGAGRTVKFLKGKRHGFMPTYLKHAVANEKDWHEEIAPRLAPETEQRWDGFEAIAAAAVAAEAQGKWIQQRCIGGYMYLRALVGPEEICYLLLDNPKLVHAMMASWLTLADTVTSRIQKHVDLDEFFLAEDICYNHGLLVSPSAVREFLFPYYQQLLTNVRRRQRRKRLFFQVDTDGFVGEALPLYRSIGMDVMSPFEVAAGNDVLAMARAYPDLVMIGGIDKRVLAQGRDAIDDYLQRLIPALVERGGFIPTCDHGVPDNVSYDDYLYYRQRIQELGG